MSPAAATRPAGPRDRVRVATQKPRCQVQGERSLAARSWTDEQQRVRREERDGTFDGYVSVRKAATE